MEQLPIIEHLLQFVFPTASAQSQSLFTDELTEAREVKSVTQDHTVRSEGHLNPGLPTSEAMLLVTLPCFVLL